MKSLPSFTPSTRDVSYFSPQSLARKQQILVVDDDESARDLQKILLHSAGYLVDAAGDGEEAWQMLRTKAYDLLLTDQNMPGLCGLELVARLRVYGMTLPVVINSAWPGLGKVSDYPQLSLAAILNRPANFGKVLNAVKEALSPPNHLNISDQIPAGGNGESRAADHAWNSSCQSTPSSSIMLPTKPTARTHPRILIADDDPILRDSLAAVLESEGYIVDVAGNGREAVARACAKRPDLVLLDLKMPQADGWTAFNQLDRISPSFPVILMTALPDQYPKALQLGADAFMEKPLNIGALVRAIQRFTSDGTNRHGCRSTASAFVTKFLDRTY